MAAAADHVRQLSFALPIKPKGQGRPQFGGGRAYTPAATRKYAAAMREAIAVAWGERAPLTGAVIVSITAEFERPKTGKYKNAEHHTCKPDGDNIAKAVLDAMSKLVFADDCQAIDTHVRKRWSVVGNCVRVTVWSVA